MKKNRLNGRIMFGVGLFMILMTTGNYIFGWEFKSPVLGIIGLVLVAVDRKLAHK